MPKKSDEVNWDDLHTPVEFTGRSITLPAEPEQMPFDAAIKALEQKKKAEEQEFNVIEWITEAHPCDAMIAFMKAVKKLHGFVSFKETPGFWSSRPPNITSVQTGHRDTDRIQVPYGDMSIPGVKCTLQTGVHEYNNVWTFFIAGCLRNRDRGVLLELANETRRIVKEESIYRGYAVTINVNKGCALDLSNPPEFMDVSDTFETSCIFDPDTEAQINVSVLTPIKKTAEVRGHNIPIERGILLEGPFGTGKSLTARMIAHVAEEHGWTFVLLNKVNGLNEALSFAKRYSPAVLFAEDIDRVMEERDDAANELINTISGVGNKRNGVMVILTTNFPEKIDPVILRPGRLDAVISLRPPHADAVQRLLRHYGGELIAHETDLTGAGAELEGQIPAVIREVVERSKLAMIHRGGFKLTDEDIQISARTMKNHLALLHPKKAELSVGDQLAQSMNKAVAPQELIEEVKLLKARFSAIEANF